MLVLVSAVPVQQMILHPHSGDDATSCSICDAELIVTVVMLFFNVQHRHKRSASYRCCRYPTHFLGFLPAKPRQEQRRGF